MLHQNLNLIEYLDEQLAGLDVAAADDGELVEQLRDHADVRRLGGLVVSVARRLPIAFPAVKLYTVQTVYKIT